MPTSDADSDTQLLQNLAVRIGAIREAIERAFGVTLPTAPTLNAEFEIITSAMSCRNGSPTNRKACTGGRIIGYVIATTSRRSVR